MLWVELPQAFVPRKLPYTSQMLARLPPQQLPPGFIPSHITEALQGWAIRRVMDHVATMCKRDMWCYLNQPADPLRAEDHEWLQDAPPAA